MFVLLARKVKEHLPTVLDVLEFAVFDLGKTHAICPDHMREKSFWHFRNNDFVYRYLAAKIKILGRMGIIFVCLPGLSCCDWLDAGRGRCSNGYMLSNMSGSMSSTLLNFQIFDFPTAMTDIGFPDFV